MVWKSNPPSSPHMGGSWKRLVRVVKTSLFIIVKGRILTDFQRNTVFTEVENMVNNRTITINSDSANDLEALTPNHFLVGRNDIDMRYLAKLIKEDMFNRKRWRQVQVITQHFWQRSLKEYLPKLTKIVKQYEDDKSVKVGDLVLLLQDGVKRGSWPSGRFE